MKDINAALQEIRARKSGGKKDIETALQEIRAKRAATVTPQPKPGAIGTAISEIGAANTKRSQVAQQSVADAKAGRITPGESLLRTFGAGAGLLGDIGGAALKLGAKGLGAVTPDFIEKPVVSLGKDALSLASPVIQKGVDAYGTFKSNNPRAATNLEAITNIATTLPIGKGAQLAGRGALGAVKPVVSAAKKADEAFIAATATKLVEKRAKAIQDLMNSGVKTKRIADRSMARGYDTAKFLAQDERFLPKVVDGKVVPDEAIIALETEVRPLAKIVRGIIDTEGKTVDANDFLKTALSKIEDLKLQGDQYNRIRSNILKDVDFYKLEYGDANGRIPLPVIDDIKIKKYENINWNDPDALSADRAIAKAGRELIDRNVDDVSVNALNKELGRFYDARDALDAMGGRAIKGGRLGRMFGRTIGTLGGAVVGGPAGLLIGGIGADKLVDILQASYFTSPTLRRIVGELKLERPGIFGEAERILKQRAVDMGERKLLTAPEAIPLGGKTSEGAFITGSMDEFRAKQGLQPIPSNQPLLGPGRANVRPEPIQLPERLQSRVDAAERARRSTGQIRTGPAPRLKTTRKRVNRSVGGSKTRAKR